MRTLKKLRARIDRWLHPSRYIKHGICRVCGAVKPKDDMVFDIYWGWFCNAAEILEYWRHN